jgi:hypothetical protein
MSYRLQHVIDHREGDGPEEPGRHRCQGSGQVHRQDHYPRRRRRLRFHSLPAFTEARPDSWSTLEHGRRRGAGSWQRPRHTYPRSATSTRRNTHQRRWPTVGDSMAPAHRINPATLTRRSLSILMARTCPIGGLQSALRVFDEIGRATRPGKERLPAASAAERSIRKAET